MGGAGRSDAPRLSNERYKKGKHKTSGGFSVPLRCCVSSVTTVKERRRHKR